MLFGRSLMRFPNKFTLSKVRFNLTSSKVTGITEKISSSVSQASYWSKVILEVSKQVYKKEGLAPPSISEFQAVYKKLYAQALEYANAPQKLLELTKVKVVKDDVIRYAAYGVQLFGLFSLGEIIGRRQIFGYPTFGEEKHH